MSRKISAVRLYDELQDVIDDESNDVTKDTPIGEFQNELVQRNFEEQREAARRKAGSGDKD